jgi:hypothetical protein
MLVVLRGLRGRALKADRRLPDPIVILKADCPGIQLYLHASLVLLADQYMPYASGSVYPLCANQELPNT